MATLKTIEVERYSTDLKNKEIVKKEILQDYCKILSSKGYSLQENVYSCTGCLYLYKTDYKRKENYFIVCLGFGCNHGHTYYTEYKSLCKKFKDIETAKTEFEAAKQQIEIMLSAAIIKLTYPEHFTN